MRTRSGASCRARDGTASVPFPHRSDRGRAGLLGRLARSAVPPGDRRPDRLPDDGLPRRGDDVHHAEAEIARPIAGLRHRLRPAHGADPPHAGRARHQGHGECRWREPTRLRRGRGRGGPRAGPRRKAQDRHRHRGRPARPARRAARPRASAQEPRYGAPAPRRARPRPLSQRLPRRVARGRGAAPRRPHRDHRPGDRYRAHARADDSCLRLEARRLGPAGGRDRGGPHHRMRCPVLGGQLPGGVAAHPRSRQRRVSDRRRAPGRYLRDHQARRHGRPHHGRRCHRAARV